MPLDYETPDNGTVELGMVRLSAPKSTRLGTLIYNPGGPGDVASDYVLGATEGLPNFGPAVLQSYDVIGLDPRGVGMSQPVKCDPDLYNIRISSFPKMHEGFKSLIAHNKALGESCLSLTGPLFDHLDTINVARDMEIVRGALDQNAKLNFLGRSYGSQIGQTYAELFPEQVGRMALDGIVDHSQSEITTLECEISTYETTLNRFFSWCNTTTNCSLHGQNAAEVFDKVVQTADEQPIPATGCASTGEYACRKDVTGEEILFNIQILLLFQNATAEYTGWDVLSTAIAQAADGNATLLSTPLATSETFWAYPALAIGCQDWLHESTRLADLTYRINMASAVAPHTRGSSQTYYYQTNCLGWPAPTTNPQRQPQSGLSKVPPILLVNAMYDPSTSIVWATEVQRQMPNSVLLTRAGSGHTSYQLRGEAAAAIDAFLANGVLPAPGTVVNT